TMDANTRRCRCAAAGFYGVAQQITEGLPEQHLVALQLAELSVDVDVAAEHPGVTAYLFGRPLADRGEADTRQRQLRRPRERQKIGDHLAERLGFAANALDVGPVRGRQGIEIEQLAVAVNRREPVPEFVRNAGG